MALPPKKNVSRFSRERKGEFLGCGVHLLSNWFLPLWKLLERWSGTVPPERTLRTRR